MLSAFNLGSIPSRGTVSNIVGVKVSHYDSFLPFASHKSNMQLLVPSRIRVVLLFLLSRYSVMKILIFASTQSPLSPFVDPTAIRPFFLIESCEVG